MICNGPHRMGSMPKALGLLKEADSYGVNPLALYYKWKLFLKSKGVVMTKHPCFCLYSWWEKEMISNQPRSDLKKL